MRKIRAVPPADILQAAEGDIEVAVRLVRELSPAKGRDLPSQKKNPTMMKWLVILWLGVWESALAGWVSAVVHEQQAEMTGYPDTELLANVLTAIAYFGERLGLWVATVEWIRVLIKQRCLR